MVNVIRNLNADLARAIMGYARFWGVKRFTSTRTADFMMVRPTDWE